MTRCRIAGIAAVFACVLPIGACSVMDLQPIPTADVGPPSMMPTASIAASPPAGTPVQLTPAGPVAVAETLPRGTPIQMVATLPTAAPQEPPAAAPVQMAAAVPGPTFGFPSANVPQFSTPPAQEVMPASEVQCRQKLKRLGVQFRDIPRIRDSASCGIDWPVEVYSLGRTIRLAPAAKLNCAMAEEAALWAQRDLAPAARTRYLSGIAEVKQMSAYSCRRIAGSRTMSEHSKGNALDIGAIKLKNGRVIDVEKPGLFAFRERSFLRKVRGEACDRFGTVLGPGYNRDHADHFHLDLKERRRTACH